LRPDDEVVEIKYFSAMVEGADDPQRPLRQQVYLRALQMDGRVSVIQEFGLFAKTEHPFPPQTDH
jgi:hypothetical protein